ncbi:MAG: Uma2 family endonuclease [Candidatus Competibacterales bacterium]
MVFEILSPANSGQEMLNKREFYQRFGGEEYYVYNPDSNRLEVWCRQGDRLVAVPHLNGWTSPRLGVRLALTPETLEIYYPNGQPFLNSIELARRVAEAEQRTLEAKRQVLAAEQQALEAKPQADQQRQLRYEAISRLRNLGLAPEQIAADLSLSPGEVRRHLAAS